MPRRKRDSESESDEGSESGSGSASGSGSGSESGSDSGSYSGSGSGSGSGSDSDSSGDDEELIKDALKDAGLKKHFRALQKGGITSVDSARRVNDKKLTKLGIDSSSDRKKLIKVLKEIESDSESDSESDGSGSGSEDEEDQIKDALKKAGCKQYAKVLSKKGVDSLKRAAKLDDAKLKKYGVDDSKDRKAILKAFKKLDDGESKSSKSKDKEDDESSASEAEGNSEEGETVRKLLAKANMKKYYSLFKKKGVDSVKKAKALQHKDLREMGIHLYRERRDIIEEFEKYNGEELPNASSGSGEESGDNVNMVHEVLRQQYMSRHIPDFDRMGITTLRQARKLTQTQLRSMGVALYLQRERLINAFADYRPKNKAIMKLLIECNLASHAREFEKLIDVEDAKNLTHSDLRAMGINLYGQRERLMRAFMEYKPKK